MHRPRFGLILAAVALMTAGSIPLFASAAGAAACGAPGGEFPMTPGAQSGWKIACNTAAAQKVDNDVIADSGAAYWHKGAARTAAVTLVNGTATVTIPGLQAADVRRPISGGCLKGGTFIKSVAGTTATLSQTKPASGCAAATVTIEHTNARVLVDASCTVAGVVTSASAVFSAADVGRSVTGGPFKDGARVSTFTNAT